MGYALMLVDCDFSSYPRSFQVHPIVKRYPTGLKIKGQSVLNNQFNQQKYNVSFDPLLTSYRNVKWEVISGTEYATIDSHGMLNAKFTTDVGVAHNVTIKASSIAVPSISDTMTVSVTCNAVVGEVGIVIPSDIQYNNGASFIIQGTLDGDDSNLIRFNPLVSKDTTASKPSSLNDLITLVDNMDGTATVTVKSPEYIHQVQFEAYNSAYTSNTLTLLKNINDFVILDAADGSDSVAKLGVFYANGKCASDQKMYMSEAYLVTEI